MQISGCGTDSVIEIKYVYYAEEELEVAEGEGSLGTQTSQA